MRKPCTRSKTVQGHCYSFEHKHYTMSVYKSQTVGQPFTLPRVESNVTELTKIGEKCFLPLLAHFIVRENLNIP